MKSANCKMQNFRKIHPFFIFQFDIFDLQFILADFSNG